MTHFLSKRLFGNNDSPRFNRSVRRIYLRRARLLILLALLFQVVFFSDTHAQQSCDSSGRSGYTVTLCFTEPFDGATLRGVEDVSVTASVSGSNPGVRRLVFYLDDEYLLTDYEAPYTFELPSDHFVDDSVTLEVEALMRDGFVTDRTTINIRLDNDVTSPPVNTNTFTPRGREPSAGDPLLLIATGDGAAGRTQGADVTNDIVALDPDMFLYLGDVYEDGTYTEFFNWYGTSERFFGRFRDITNPILGNHEEHNNEAPGYEFYWDNVPDFYSFDRGGWHMIALNSNSGFDEFEPGTAQYDWLEDDLAANDAACTLVFFHHPVYSVGPQGDTERLDEIWALMAQAEVDVVLAGHDHSYQRWHPLDENGNRDSEGITQFVAGAGGHGVQGFDRNDSRLAEGADSRSGLGSLVMELHPDRMSFEYVNIDEEVLDSGVIRCSGGSAPDTTPPSRPSDLAATTPNGEVVLTWDASTDNTGIASYRIYRDGSRLDSVDGTTLTYTDDSALLDTNYSYRVDAVDPGGNNSALSSPVSLRTPDARTLTLTPEADSYVNADRATSNFGSNTSLRTDGSPQIRTYLRFEVPTLGGSVTDATLRVFANSSSSSGYTVHDVQNDSWAESSINYNNAPTVGSSVGDSDSFSSNSWTSVDLSSLVTQDGDLSVALLSSSSSSIRYSSRESSNPPELRIRLSTGAPSGEIFTFEPVADTYVRADEPTRTYGSRRSLRTDGSPEINSYIHFDVENVTGAIQSATLRIYANSRSSVGYRVHGVTNNSWSESSTHFDNAPTIGSQIDSSGPVSRDSWTEVDVTNLVTSEGFVSFALTSTSSGAISYSSRQGANPPELVIVTTE
ncbi:MAG: DUF7594 domain-containing protein [Ardenticatenaceae bacterium]